MSSGLVADIDWVVATVAWWRLSSGLRVSCGLDALAVRPMVMMPARFTSLMTLGGR